MEEHLGQRVRRIRKSAGISKAQLAEATGLHPTHITKIESGSRPNVAGTTLVALARALGTTAEHLLEGIGADPSAAESLSAVRNGIARSKASETQQAAVA